MRRVRSRTQPIWWPEARDPATNPVETLGNFSATEMWLVLPAAAFAVGVRRGTTGMGTVGGSFECVLAFFHTHTCV